MKWALLILAMAAGSFFLSLTPFEWLNVIYDVAVIITIILIYVLVFRKKK
ncbi:hypothetical protein J2W91_001473 [Paenibacillus amylolyticus]|uniref:Uncharacterized protein n=1 Tax=Paenibacillus amylolyticus TaxID=1451 RepID=A0AAP5LLF9_PAEAM|nr:hypothetical protein [Paenibacillus amylolyticus]